MITHAAARSVRACRARPSHLRTLRKGTARQPTTRCLLSSTLRCKTAERLESFNNPDHQRIVPSAGTLDMWIGTSLSINTTWEA